MAGFYDVLKIEPWACPEGCFACLEACVERKEKKGVAVIKATTKPGETKHSVETCFQCSEPKCLESCPTGAITKDEKTGVVHISEEECIGCEACVPACLYGQMYFDATAGVATKCELCQ
ncbi:MAG: 4Fe-4S dicluster domain-containing protein, partial [Chloroflexota bacterium]